MNDSGSLVLGRREVAARLDLDACIEAVENAFRMHGEGRTEPPGVLGIHVPEGGFHIKAGSLRLDRPYFVAKVNANFPHNPARSGRPTVQGVIVLCDAEDGHLLALMDSIEITLQRTAAATAVAARHLARPRARTVTICGCGAQGRIQLQAICRVRPIERAFAFDVDPGRAAGFAAELGPELGIEVRPVAELALAAERSDIVITCTPSRRIVLHADAVAPGCFVAGVGADHPEKQELDPELLGRATVVVDVLEQCAGMGDLHHALAGGFMTRDRVHAELGEIVAGRRPGRTSDAEVTVFDSTGMALQDAAAAALVYRRALQAGGLPSFRIDA